MAQQFELQAMELQDLESQIESTLALQSGYKLAVSGRKWTCKYHSLASCVRNPWKAIDAFLDKYAGKDITEMRMEDSNNGTEISASTTSSSNSSSSNEEMDPRLRRKIQYLHTQLDLKLKNEPSRIGTLLMASTPLEFVRQFDLDYMFDQAMLESSTWDDYLHVTAIV